MLEGVGLGWRGHSSCRHVAARQGAATAGPDPARRSRSDGPSVVDDRSRYALSTAPSGRCRARRSATRPPAASWPSDDRHPAHRAARVADTFREPGAQRQIRLVAQPEPGQLDHRCGAGAGCRTWRSPARGRSRRSARGSAPARRRPRPAAGCRTGGTGPRATAARRAAADPLQPEQRRDGWLRLARRPASRSAVARLLDLGDLRADQLEPLDLAHELGLQAVPAAAARRRCAARRGARRRSLRSGS